MAQVRSTTSVVQATLTVGLEFQWNACDTRFEVELADSGV